MLARIKFFPVLIIFVLTSCSSAKQKPVKGDEPLTQKTLTEVLAPNSGQEIFQKIDEKLDELAKVAKKAGPHAINYLTSDIFLKANAASVYGDHKTSTFLYKKLLTLVPNDSFVKKKLSMELIKGNELTEAKKILKEIFSDKNFKDEKVGLLLGAIETALGDNKSAKKTYRQTLARYPKNHDACVYLARSYFSESEENLKNKKRLFNKAITTLRNCEKKNKAQGIFSFYMGKFYLDTKNEKNAIRYFQKALKINRLYYQAAVGLGILYEEKEDFKNAIKTYKQYLKNDPDNGYILARLVQILFSQEKFEEVLPYAENLAYLDSSDVNLRVKLGILYADTKKYDEAIDIFKDIHQRYPEADRVTYYLGAIYQDLKDYQKAVKYFLKINESSSLFIDGTLQIAFMLQSLALIQSDVNDKAVERFFLFVEERAEKIEKLKYELLVMKANWYEEKNNYNKAISVLEKYSEEEKFTEGQRYYLASLYDKNKQHDKAFELIESLLKNNPQNAHALNFLGYSLLERGENIDLAFQYISKAVKLMPEDGYIRDSLGWYYYKIGKLELALKHLRLAQKTVKEDAIVNKHLAIVYQSLKRYNDAKKHYELSLENTKLLDEKEVIKQALEELEGLRKPASKK